MKMAVKTCVYLSLLIVNVGAANQKDVNTVILKAKFNAAVASEGDEYFALRESILGYGREAEPFLLDEIKSDQLHARIVASALLVWMRDNIDPQIRIGNTSEEIRRMARTHDNSEMMQIDSQLSKFHIYERIAYDLSYVEGVRGDPTWKILMRAEIGCVDEVQHSLLLEAVLKGFPPNWKHRYGSHEEHAKMLAASLSGKNSTVDTVNLLTEIYDTDESRLVRMGAVRGLEMTGNATVIIPPLIKALRDESEDVRRIAYVALRNLSDDDLGINQRELTRKVGPEQIEAAEKWWADNREIIAREGIRRKTAIERLQEWINADGRYGNLYLVVEQDTAGGKPRYALHGSVQEQRDMREIHREMLRLGLWNTMPVKVKIDMKR